MDSGERQKDRKMSLNKSPPPTRLEGVQHVTGGEQRTITGSSNKKEVARPKQEWLSVMNVSTVESKV